MGDIKLKVNDFLAAHEHLNLATADAQGKPYAATVAYASGNGVLYFITGKSTHKYQNIEVNANVGFTSDVEGGTMQNVKSLQMQGTASPVTDKEEADRAMGMLLEKFPQMKGMPPNPDMVMVRITLTEGYMLDYTQGFMHRDAVKY